VELGLCSSLELEQSVRKARERMPHVPEAESVTEDLTEE